MHSIGCVRGRPQSPRLAVPTTEYTRINKLMQAASNGIDSSASTSSRVAHGNFTVYPASDVRRYTRVRSPRGVRIVVIVSAPACRDETHSPYRVPVN